MKVGLYLMTTKGITVLAAAIRCGVPLAHVTTAEAVGMDDVSHKTIAEIAKANGIPTFTRAHPPTYTGDWSIAAGWRWMLLDTPNLVVLHDSLLPKYRGHAPLITALCNGEPEVGVTAFLAADEPDAGPIVAQRSIPVTYPTTMHETLHRLLPLYASLAETVLNELQTTGALRYAAQDHSQATWSVWRDENDYRIDWTRSADQIQRLIGAAGYPFPGAWTIEGYPLLGEEGWRQVRIQDAVVVADRPFEQRHPGKVAYLADGDPVVICGSGMLRLR